MPSFSATLPVNTTPARLWALLCDTPRVAALFSFMTIEDIQSPEPQRRIFWRRLRIPSLAELRWQEEERVTGDRELSFHAVAGDLRIFAGCWRALPNGDGAQLALALEYDIPAGDGPPAPAALVRYVMNELFTTICRRIVEAAEEEAG